VRLHRTIFLDLDDTLYPSSSGVWDAIGLRINAYIEERLGIPSDRVAALRDEYFRSYGTTLNGLVANYHIDPGDYLSFVHDLPLEDRLRPDPDLRRMLEALPQKRVILTNASRQHAERVLDLLGVRHTIDQVIDILALGLTNKPKPEAFRRAQALAEEPEAAACVVVDDSLRNLLAAAGLGMTTVLVGQDSAEAPIDYRISRIVELAQAIPGLMIPPPRRSGHAG